VAPKNAVIDFESKRGVWVPTEENRARFAPVQLGIEGPDHIEILGGLKEGDKFVTTGAAAVRNNDQLVIAGQGGPPGGQGGGNFQRGQADPGGPAKKFGGEGQRKGPPQ
jgi:hypothetical protein